MSPQYPFWVYTQENWNKYSNKYLYMYIYSRTITIAKKQKQMSINRWVDKEIGNDGNTDIRETGKPHKSGLFLLNSQLLNICQQTCVIAQYK